MEHGSGMPAAEPAPGDYVVVRSIDGQPTFPAPHAGERWTVVVWGQAHPDDPKLTNLDLAEARAIARVCAATSGREPWDGSGAFFTRLPRAPLVYVDVTGHSFTLSCEVTDPARLARSIRWRSVSNLTRDGVVAALADEGFPLDHAEVLVSRASKEPAPRDGDVCTALAEASTH